MCQDAKIGKQNAHAKAEAMLDALKKPSVSSCSTGNPKVVLVLAPKHPCTSAGERMSEGSDITMAGETQIWSCTKREPACCLADVCYDSGYIPSNIED